MALHFSNCTDPRRIIVLMPHMLDRWQSTQPQGVRDWIADHGFCATLGQVLPLPIAKGDVLLGLGTPQTRARTRFGALKNMDRLPADHYAISYEASDIDPAIIKELALGWLLSAYRFDTYAPQSGVNAHLVCPDGINARETEIQATAESLVRDLINTPACDMGPDMLEAAIKNVAREFNVSCNVITGDALLDQNFPLIHAVGRAAHQAPRLAEFNWGTQGPQICLIGKGICFDTGGLNIKPGSSMGLMKKDMGGAANVLGLAQMIMAHNLPVRLRVLIPIAENAISSQSFRPQDILKARNGQTVEINNTDAEGRLVLADALAYADEAPCDLMICMATLTGAARVAVGPDIAPYFTDDAPLAVAIDDGGRAAFDPVWRLPFHTPYEPMIEPGIADLDNAPQGGLAGAITAALFLRRFVKKAGAFVHFDIYGWQPTSAPARPKGGALQGVRAVFAAIEARFL